jgi:alkanesulfonate monooxygenase SsuD/methylene tetrahydromethanopterin reductase-like flavin-dependent oxidoreductase (luciferase family)
MRAYVAAVRELLNGRGAEVEGRFTPPPARSQAMPLLIATDGPRGLRLAGEMADGVIIAVGRSPEAVDRKVAIVREAAERFGRDPSDVEVWGRCLASVRDTREEVVAEVGAFLASIAGWAFKAPHMRALVPEGLKGAIEEMEGRFDPVNSVKIGGEGAALLEELGLTALMLGLNAIAGTPEDVGLQLDELARHGVGCVIAGMPGNADPEGTLIRFSQAAGKQRADRRLAGGRK